MVRNPRGRPTADSEAKRAKCAARFCMPSILALCIALSTNSNPGHAEQVCTPPAQHLPCIVAQQGTQHQSHKKDTSMSAEACKSRTNIRHQPTHPHPALRPPARTPNPNCKVPHNSTPTQHNKITHPSTAHRNAAKHHGNKRTHAPSTPTDAARKMHAQPQLIRLQTISNKKQQQKQQQNTNLQPQACRTSTRHNDTQDTSHTHKQHALAHDTQTHHAHKRMRHTRLAAADRDPPRELVRVWWRSNGLPSQPSSLSGKTHQRTKSAGGRASPQDSANAPEKPSPDLGRGRGENYRNITSERTRAPDCNNRAEICPNATHCPQTPYGPMPQYDTGRTRVQEPLENQAAPKGARQEPQTEPIWKHKPHHTIPRTNSRPKLLPTAGRRSTRPSGASDSRGCSHCYSRCCSRYCSR
jgi:hypothetical protein